MKRQIADGASAPATQAAAGPREAKALRLTQAPTSVLNVSGVKPREALQMLKHNLPKDPMSLKEWRQGARVAAVMGSCPRSRGSFISGPLCVDA